MTQSLPLIACLRTAKLFDYFYNNKFRLLVIDWHFVLMLLTGYSNSVLVIVYNVNGRERIQEPRKSVE